jgi:ABC-type multidrug transport system ATPase subunit
MRESGATNTGLDDLICRFGIDAYVQKRIKKLPIAMRKRVELVCALLGNPKLMVPDEPLNSLDMQGVFAFKDILGYYRERGHIVRFPATYWIFSIPL